MFRRLYKSEKKSVGYQRRSLSDLLVAGTKMVEVSGSSKKSNHMAQSLVSEATVCP